MDTTPSRVATCPCGRAKSSPTLDPRDPSPEPPSGSGLPCTWTRSNAWVNHEGLRVTLPPRRVTPGGTVFNGAPGAPRKSQSERAGRRPARGRGGGRLAPPTPPQTGVSMRDLAGGEASGLRSAIRPQVGPTLGRVDPASAIESQVVSSRFLRI